MIVAEIGNCHFGNLTLAKELIRLADACGADVIKSQAFRAEDLAPVGSMPLSFYKQCEFTINEYMELIDYARDIGNDLFYSIFSPGFERLLIKQHWVKYSAYHTRRGRVTKFDDHENVLISLPPGIEVPKLKHPTFMHVTGYLDTDANLPRIAQIAETMKNRAGYSDHTIGIQNCIDAAKVYNASVIEKHFCLVGEQKWGGVVFRDTVHGATPKQFETLAREITNVR